MADLPSETNDPSADRAAGNMEWPRIPGYQIEARIGAGGWPWCSGRVTNGSAGRWR
jgi:hypothetical protein